MAEEARKKVRQEILKHLDRLPPDAQRQVLDYICALSLPKGIPGQQLLRFAGILTIEDARAIGQAIEAGCEQVEADEW